MISRGHAYPRFLLVDFLPCRRSKAGGKLGEAVARESRRGRWRGHNTRTPRVSLQRTHSHTHMDTFRNSPKRHAGHGNAQLIFSIFLLSRLFDTELGVPFCRVSRQSIRRHWPGGQFFKLRRVLAKLENVYIYVAPVDTQRDDATGARLSIVCFRMHARCVDIKVARSLLAIFNFAFARRSLTQIYCRARKGQWGKPIDFQRKIALCPFGDQVRP